MLSHFSGHGRRSRSLGARASAGSLAGGRRRPAVALESLERRALLTYTATISPATVATFVGTGGDTLIFGSSGGLLTNNRVAAGDPGFVDQFDFDSTVIGVQTLAAAATSTVNADAPSPLDDVVTLGTASNSADLLLATFDFSNFAPGTDSLNIDLTSSVIANNTITYDLGSGGASAITGTGLNIQSGAAWTGGVTIFTADNQATTIDVLSVFAGQPLTVDAGGGATTVNVSQTGGEVNVEGGGGDDVVAFVGDGTLGPGVFNGNGGTNLLDYSGIAVGAGVAVDLAAGTADRTSGVTGIQDVTGSPGDDTLNGDAQVNTIRGGPGNDTIDPNGGPGTPGDFVFGDEGDDIIIWDPGEGTDFVDGGTGNNTQIVNRGGGNNAMFVRVDDLDPTHTFFDGTGFTIDLLLIQELVVNGQGGTDTLTVDFVNGSPFTNLTGIAGGPGISYDGGSAADRLVLQRSGGTYTATSETYTATGPGAGEISFDGGVIAFTSLDPVDDTVPATNFTVSLPPGGNLVDILDGPVVSGFATTQIASAEARRPSS